MTAISASCTDAHQQEAACAIGATGGAAIWHVQQIDAGHYLNSSPVTWVEFPAPPILPGLPLAQAVNSEGFGAGNDGFTSMTRATPLKLAIRCRGGN
jgi:hypothetical protein